jgi:hypothetical protein
MSVDIELKDALLSIVKSFQLVSDSVSTAASEAGVTYDSRTVDRNLYQLQCEINDLKIDEEGEE